jgi:hypothetical protein
LGVMCAGHRLTRLVAVLFSGRKQTGAEEGGWKLGCCLSRRDPQWLPCALCQFCLPPRTSWKSLCRRQTEFFSSNKFTSKLCLARRHSTLHSKFWVSVTWARPSHSWCHSGSKWRTCGFNYQCSPIQAILSFPLGFLKCFK